MIVHTLLALLFTTSQLSAHWVNSQQYREGLREGSYKLVCGYNHEVIGQVVKYSYTERWEAHFLAFTQNKEKVTVGNNYDSLQMAKDKVEWGAVYTGTCLRNKEH
jgi:hypothetical protein